MDTYRAGNRDGESSFLRKVGNFLTYCTMSCLRREWSQFSSPWQPKVSDLIARNVEWMHILCTDISLGASWTQTGKGPRDVRSLHFSLLFISVQTNARRVVHDKLPTLPSKSFPNQHLSMLPFDRTQAGIHEVHARAKFRSISAVRTVRSNLLRLYA
jgi:hypothetical protein